MQKQNQQTIIQTITDFEGRDKVKHRYNKSLHFTSAPFSWCVQKMSRTCVPLSHSDYSWTWTTKDPSSYCSPNRQKKILSSKNQNPIISHWEKNRELMRERPAQPAQSMTPGVLSPGPSLPFSAELIYNCPKKYQTMDSQYSSIMQLLIWKPSVPGIQQQGRVFSYREHQQVH